MPPEASHPRILISCARSDGKGIAAELLDERREDPGALGGRVADLTHILSGEPEAFSTLEAATSRLAELLVDRRLLLVIDDVWIS